MVAKSSNESPAAQSCRFTALSACYRYAEKDSANNEGAMIIAEGVLIVMRQ